MAGRGTISVNQTAQYGDKTALDRASKAVTETPMTGNPTPTRGAGRPPVGGQTAPGGQPVPTGAPPAHQEAAAEVARKAWAAQYWANLAQRPDAGPRTKMYAEITARALRDAVGSARNRTPYFS